MGMSGKDLPWMDMSRRRRIIGITALSGLICGGISCALFIVSDREDSFISLLALLFLLPALPCSFIAINLSLRDFTRHSSSTARRQPGGGIRPVRLSLAERKRAIRRLLVLPAILILLIMYILILLPVAQSYVGSAHFGAFVNLFIIPFPLLSLLYVFSSRQGQGQGDTSNTLK